MYKRSKLQQATDASYKTDGSVRERLARWQALSNSEHAQATPYYYTWGLFPWLILSSSVGVLLVAIAYLYSRSGSTAIEPVFWAGLLLVVVPIAARLIAVAPSRHERIALLIVLGLSLYLIKYIHSPFMFTFSDEFVHSYNVLQIIQNKTLFNGNNILPVTPLYPGLEIVTATFSSLSGLPVFESGLIVVGFARTIMILALFLLYERLSGSQRVAGIGTLLYVGTPNFVFWSVQFSYESLSLPMAVVVLYAIARRGAMQDQSQHIGMTLFILMTIPAIVMTHHLTTYALVGFLILLSALYVVYHRWGKVEQPHTWGISFFALTAAVTWLFFVASLTLSYLSPVLTRAIVSIFDLAAGEETGRQLFQSNSGYVAPLWERITGIGAVLLLLLAAPLGLWQIWRKHLGNAFVLLLGGAALGYFGALGMRFTPAGWETGNRAASFMFIGLAFTVALGFVEFWSHTRFQKLITTLFPAYVAVVLLGGIIAGWQPNLRLARPLVVAVADRATEPQGVTMARWFQGALGSDHFVGADSSNALLLLLYADQHVITGRSPDISGLIREPGFATWQKKTLQTLEYVVVDRRNISWNVMEGIYFDQLNNGVLPETDLLDRDIYTKFETLPEASRIFDSGNITIYDVSHYYQLDRSEHK